MKLRKIRSEFNRCIAYTPEKYDVGISSPVVVNDVFVSKLDAKIESVSEGRD